MLSGRFDTSGSMIPLLVPEIELEGGCPERDGGEGEEEEGQVWRNSMSLMSISNSITEFLSIICK